MTAYAICANPLPGLVRASVVGASNSLDFRSVVATCPVAKVLTGAGYELNGVTGEGIVDDFRPNGGPATPGVGRLGCVRGGRVSRQLVRHGVRTPSAPRRSSHSSGAAAPRVRGAAAPLTGRLRSRPGVGYVRRRRPWPDAGRVQCQRGRSRYGGAVGRASAPRTSPDGPQRRCPNAAGLVPTRRRCRVCSACGYPCPARTRSPGG